MKELSKSSIDDSQVAIPAGSETHPATTPHDPTSMPGEGSIAQRMEEVAADTDPVAQRSDGNAVEADRHPVQAPRSQDADRTANHGVTITTEGGEPVAPLGSTLR